MLNKVMLIGRLGQDPEIRYAQTAGTPIASLRIATDDSYTSRDGTRQERTEWHRVVAFDRLAENCSNYLTKGSLVFVEGRLQTRKWQDQQGQDRYTTEIVAQRVQFLDRKGESSEPYDDGGEHGARPPRGQGPARGQQRQYGGESPKRRQQEPPEDQGQAYPSENSDMDGLPF